MVTTDFEEKLAKGRIVERLILLFMCSIGYIIAPLSCIEDIKGKGPRLYFPNPKYINHPILVPSPDLYCVYGSDGEPPFGLPSELLIDAKAKERCSFYHINRAWQSGIDKSSRSHYLKSSERLHKDVWVFHYIQETSKAHMDEQRVPDNKRPAPTGLYAHPVSQAPAYDRYPEKSRLAYWKIEDMKHLATLEEVLMASRGKAA